jgi:hypothetical protein
MPPPYFASAGRTSKHKASNTTNGIEVEIATVACGSFAMTEGRSERPRSKLPPATRPFDFAQGRLYAGTSKEMREQAAVAYPSIALGTGFVRGKSND